MLLVSSVATLYCNFTNFRCVKISLASGRGAFGVLNFGVRRCSRECLMYFSHWGVFLNSVKPLTTENTEYETTPEICKITVFYGAENNDLTRCRRMLGLMYDWVARLCWWAVFLYLGQQQRMEKDKLRFWGQDRRMHDRWLDVSLPGLHLQTKMEE